MKTLISIFVAALIGAGTNRVKMPHEHQMPASKSGKESDEHKHEQSAKQEEKK